LFEGAIGPSSGQPDNPAYWDAVALVNCLGATLDFNRPGGAPGTFSDNGLPIGQTVRGLYAGVTPGRAGLALLTELAVDSGGFEKFAMWSTTDDQTNTGTLRIDQGIFMVRPAQKKSGGPRCK
jgi:hypothetical protein